LVRNLESGGREFSGVPEQEALMEKGKLDISLESSDTGADREIRKVETVFLADDGSFPNNSDLPLLIYPKAMALPDADPARAFEERFSQNGWGNSWRNGIFPYHHYHSTAHEVLGIYRGSATVLFGGEAGVTRTVKTGDVVVIPAGVAHKSLEWSSDLGVVGAYPGRQRPNLLKGREGERPEADQNIASVPLPEGDPVHGAAGPLMDHWNSRKG
jgi:uncharacterized protein YjlB